MDRFIGRYYMDFANSPLKNLHNLEIPSPDFATYLEKIHSINQIKPDYEHSKIHQTGIIITYEVKKPC